MMLENLSLSIAAQEETMEVLKETRADLSSTKQRLEAARTASEQQATEWAVST